MSSFTIQVELNRFPDLASAVASQVRLALEQTAADTEAIARENAPVASGRLRDSITHQTNSPNEAEVAVGADYGASVEYGTAHHAAHPFLRPALEQVQETFAHGLAESIEGGLSKSG